MMGEQLVLLYYLLALIAAAVLPSSVITTRPQHSSQVFAKKTWKSASTTTRSQRRAITGGGGGNGIGKNGSSSSSSSSLFAFVDGRRMLLEQLKRGNTTSTTSEASSRWSISPLFRSLQRDNNQKRPCRRLFTSIDGEQRLAQFNRNSGETKIIDSFDKLFVNSLEYDFSTDTILGLVNGTVLADVGHKQAHVRIRGNITGDDVEAGTTFFSSLAVSSFGEVYAYSPTNTAIYVLDKITARATLIGETGLENFLDMAYWFQADFIFATNGTSLFVIDIINRQLGEVGPFSGDALPDDQTIIQSVVITPRGALFGVTDEVSNATIFEFDKFTATTVDARDPVTSSLPSRVVGGTLRCPLQRLPPSAFPPREPTTPSPAGGTAAPTTPFPTPAGTPSPTAPTAPTAGPTITPLPTPDDEPDGPTQSPATPFPTPSEPTSAEPTSIPSSLPSSHPSSTPSSLPSSIPTSLPSSIPTSIPSESPTPDVLAPTPDGPTPGATDGPTPAAPTAEAESWDTDLNLENVPEQAKSAFEAARDRWDGIITEGESDVPDVGGTLDPCTVPTFIDDMWICASSEEIDGPSGTLGFAGPVGERPDTGIPFAGLMVFDTEDIDQKIEEGEFTSIVLHEMAHVFGIGTLWDDFELSDSEEAPCNYVESSRASAEYQALSGCEGQAVPLEQEGGQGTACGHWDEECFIDELMTGFLSGSDQPLSRLTIAGFDDLGYSVDYDAADPYDSSRMASFCLCEGIGVRDPPAAKEPLSAKGYRAMISAGRAHLVKMAALRETWEESSGNNNSSGIVYVADKVVHVFYEDDNGLLYDGIVRA